MSDGASPAAPSGLRALLELLGLSGIAVVQPVLADFGAAPDYFVFVQATAGQIAVFGLLVALVPAIVLWGLGRLAARLDRRWALPVHAAAVGLLAAVLVLQLATAADLSDPVAWLLTVATGGAAGVARYRWAGVGLWAAWLTPAPLMFLALFLFASPVSGLVTGGDVDTAELGAFGSGPPPPVVMIVLDEWPLASIVRGDGTIDADLYPNVAALAGDATWYRDTTTVANLTNFAVPALLTGRHPEEGATADASSHPENLFTLLGGTYRLDVTERITRLCPAALCGSGGGGATGTDPASVGDLLAEARAVLADRLGLAERTTPTTDVFVEPDAAVEDARADGQGQSLDDLLAPRPETLDRFLAGLRRDEEPTLHFLHLLAPHTPHRHLPDGRLYEADPALRLINPVEGADDDDQRAPAAPAAELDRRRLQFEVAHVDRLLGDVVDRLRRVGLYDNALLVVTSDHGLAFRPGTTVRGLGPEPVEAEAEPELLWVPLFVKAPGQDDGAVSDVPAQTTDVLPTIADLLGIDLPWAVDGLALADVTEGRERRYWRVQGSTFATFELDPPRRIEAEVTDVHALGVDSVLPGQGPDRWWRIAGGDGTVGDPATGTRLPAVIDGLEAFAAIDPEAGTVPAVVSGRVATGADRVLVAVNGRVAALARTYDDGDGPGRFAVLLPPALLVAGANPVTVHAAPVTPR